MSEWCDIECGLFSALFSHSICAASCSAVQCVVVRWSGQNKQ